jgi:hypothetical protein
MAFRHSKQEDRESAEEQPLDVVAVHQKVRNGERRRRKRERRRCEKRHERPGVREDVAVQNDHRGGERREVMEIVAGGVQAEELVIEPEGHEERGNERRAALGLPRGGRRKQFAERPLHDGVEQLRIVPKPPLRQRRKMRCERHDGDG